MNRTLLSTTVWLGLLLNAELGGGACTSTWEPQRTSNFEVVKVVFGPGAASIQAAISQGSNQWNNSACVTSLNPVPYPYFSTSGTLSPGTPVITVIKLNGFRSATGSSICGLFEGVQDGSSASITVYELARRSDGTEFSCGLDDPGVGGDLIAHELGHYLNLDNSPCIDAIMGPGRLIQSGGQLVMSDSQQIMNSECSLADFQSMTPYEQEERECVSDPEPCTGTSPILIDLDRNSFHLANGPVFFDINADGQFELISWTSPDQEDAFLCFDRNENGIIDDGSELFGDSTPMAAGHPAQNGYLALAEFDESYGGNFDGWITADDALFDRLCLWLDRNHDGFSEPHELQTLHDAGVVAIDLEFRYSHRQDQYGNELRYIGDAWIIKNGKVKKTATTDVFFVRYE